MQIGPKLIWPVLFKRCIDDGFGVTTGLRKDILYWIEKFNELRDTIKIDKYNWGNAVDYMDLFIYKGTLFTWMVKYVFRYIKKKPISLCTSRFALFINVILSRTMFGAN